MIPSTRGETIAQLHDRLATALSSIIADVDAEVAAHEQATGSRSSKAILICSHAAPLIAIGRALTGNMPDDPDEEDFNVFTAGLSTFRRRRALLPVEGGAHASGNSGRDISSLAPGTKLTKDTITVPQWRGGRGVGGGWDCVANGDCSFLSEGAERGWYVSFFLFFFFFLPYIFTSFFLSPSATPFITFSLIHSSFSNPNNDTNKSR